MRAIWHQMLRFGTVGLLATLTHYACAVVAMRLGIAPVLANGIAFGCAFGVGFAGHLRWSFREQHADFATALLRYAIVAFAGFALNQFLFASLADRSSLPPEVLLAAVLLFVAGLNFVISKWWAFRAAAKGGEAW